MEQKAQKKITPQTHFLVTESYLMTRGAALHFPSKQFSQMIKNNHTVYGAVIDIPINPQILITLVVYINGASNLYFNNGGSYTGAGQRYPTVVQIGRAFIANSNRILGEAKKTTKLDLPTGREHHIFLLTRDGIYKKVLSPTALTEETADMRTFYILYQRLMTELRATQAKDRTIANSKKSDSSAK